MEYLYHLYDSSPRLPLRGEYLLVFFQSLTEIIVKSHAANYVCASIFISQPHAWELSRVYHAFVSVNYQLLIW